MSERRRLFQEPFNAISHWVGVVLALAGTARLLVVSAGKPLFIVAFAIYGVALTALYSASATYHTFPSTATWLRKLDHGAIYLVIAGTYVPICLIALAGRLGTGMLIAETVMAITGIVAVSCWGGGPKWLRLVLYLGMGWIAVIALGPLFASLGWEGVAWLLAGGLAYSVGTVFYATKWPKMWPGVFSSHELWHLFVLAGSACHFAVMLRIERLPLP